MRSAVPAVRCGAGECIRWAWLPFLPGSSNESLGGRSQRCANAACDRMDTRMTIGRRLVHIRRSGVSCCSSSVSRFQAGTSEAAAELCSIWGQAAPGEQGLAKAFYTACWFAVGLGIIAPGDKEVRRSLEGILVTI